MSTASTPTNSDQTHRLDSWKQIAGYLNRGVTTVQRWEQDSGLPVHRLAHAKRGSVFAYRSELDLWMRDRTLSGQPELAPEAAPPVPNDSLPVQTSRRRAYLWLASAAAVLVIVTVAWRSLNRPAGASAAPTTHLIVPLATDEARERSPSISPDGQRVVYEWARSGAEGLYIRRIAGGEPERLDVGSLDSAGYPQWSPRGDRIAFLVPEGGRRGVYVMSLEGRSAPRRLTSTTGLGVCWSADGRTLAVADRNTSGEPLSIFGISIETGQRQRLTTPPASSFGDTFCAFSSDGRLAVVRHFTRYQSDVCLVNLRTNGETRLTKASEGITGLAWSPDEREIIYGSANGLWRVSTAGTGAPPRPMVQSGGALVFPAISRPTGSTPARLVYEARVVDVNLWKTALAPLGRAHSNRVAGSPVWDDSPDLSPTGDSIAFVSNRTGVADVWVAAADGTGPRQITFNSTSPGLIPRWSPDGRQLVYTLIAAGNQDVYVSNLDEPGARRLTWETSLEENPSWSRDGRWIYFRSDRQGVSRIWRTRSDGTGPAEQVSIGEGSQAFESADGRTVYFVRQAESPGLWSVNLGAAERRETMVAPHVREGLWGVADTAVVYLVTWPLAVEGGPSLRGLSLRSGRVWQLAVLPGDVRQVVRGFTVSRDARTVLWTRMDRSDGDVMMTEPWTR